MHMIRTQTEPGAMPKGVQVRLYGGLAADERGSDDGRSPLVLLHGLTFDRSMWRPAANAT